MILGAAAIDGTALPFRTRSMTGRAVPCLRKPTSLAPNEGCASGGDARTANLSSAVLVLADALGEVGDEDVYAS